MSWLRHKRHDEIEYLFRRYTFIRDKQFEFALILRSIISILSLERILYNYQPIESFLFCLYNIFRKDFVKKSAL